MPCGLDLERHVGEHELHGLKLGDRLAELLAFHRILDARVVRALRDPERHRADRDAAAGERLEELLVADALVAQQLVARDEHVLEMEFDGVRRAQAHLLLVLADLESGRALFDDERSDALRPCDLSVFAVTTTATNRS